MGLWANEIEKGTKVTLKGIKIYSWGVIMLNAKCVIWIKSIDRGVPNPWIIANWLIILLSSFVIIFFIY